jgi:uncharacterized protein (DUF927 family)
MGGRGGAGKSIAQHAQAASTGNPKNGESVMFSLETTKNAIEELAAMGSGSTLALDEAGNLPDSKGIMSSLIFKLCGENSKYRQESQGGLRENQPEWCTFVTVSNEFSIKSVIEGTGEAYRQGTGVRVLDLDVSGAENIPKEAKKLRRAMFANYGHALPEFIRYLFKADYVTDQGKEKALAEIDELADAIAGVEPSAALRRAADVLALGSETN